MTIQNIELTLEVNNLKQMLKQTRDDIAEKCADCGSVIAEKYFKMEQFCKRCSLSKYKEKEVKSG